MDASESVEIASKSNRGLRTLNRTQWITLICLSLGNIGISTCASLQAPFFPKEAELKGTTPAEYGLVFGLFYLTAFVFSPICGKLVPVVNPEFLRDCGILIVGVCFILFGFLDKSPPGKTFLALAYIIRVTEGIGSAAFRTSNFVIVAVVFPEHMATALGCTETMYGLGMILGPSLGSALYQLSGYTLPFVSAGSFLLVIGAVTYFLLPKIDHVPDIEKPTSFLKFWKSPLVILYIVQLILTTSCMGFNMVTLEPHLRQFKLSQMYIGLIFIIGAVVYGASSPLWGYFVDKRINLSLLAALSSFLIAICFTMIGPAPFIKVNSSVALISVCLSFFGLGFGGTRVIAFVHCYESALKRGLSNDMTTKGIISGTFTSAFSIGYFMGPTIGGVAYEHFGYPTSSCALAVVMYLVSLTFVSYAIVQKSKPIKISSDESEQESLLQNSSVQSDTVSITTD